MTTAHPVDVKKLSVQSLADPEALSGFVSGEAEIDNNIEKCCSWHERYRCRTFCAFHPGIDFALGYYCMGISATESKYLDHSIIQDSGTFGYVPFIYLNYLAVRTEYQNNKVGTVLLLNALERAANTIRNIGVYGVALNALNDRAAGLYDRYGFRALDEQHRYPFMILPARSVLDLFGETS